MTLNTTALTLFSSTIATGLGFAMITTSIGAGYAGESIATLIGMTLLLAGQAVFVSVGVNAVRKDRRTLGLAIGAFLAGVASVWFWLVPAQTAFLVVACEYDHLGACETVADQGGYPAALVRENDAFIVYACELKQRAEYCRLAAAKRLSHPSKFCPMLSSETAFEVVEWCTPNTDNTVLVSRR